MNLSGTSKSWIQQNKIMAGYISKLKNQEEEILTVLKRKRKFRVLIGVEAMGDGGARCRSSHHGFGSELIRRV